MEKVRRELKLSLNTFSWIRPQASHIIKIITYCYVRASFAYLPKDLLATSATSSATFSLSGSRKM